MLELTLEEELGLLELALTLEEEDTLELALSEDNELSLERSEELEPLSEEDSLTDAEELVSEAEEDETVPPHPARIVIIIAAISRMDKTFFMLSFLFI